MPHLFRPTVCAAGFVALAMLAPARADDVEAVKEKLFQAKKEYDGETRKFRAAVTEALDKREDAARKAGDKKALDAVKADRDRFDKTGEPPPTTPKVLVAQIQAARGKLDKAYTSAVKDLVKLKEDAVAEAIEKEQQKVAVEAAMAFGKKTALTALKPSNVRTERDGFNHDTEVKIPGETLPHCIRLDPPSEGASQISYTLGGKYAALRVRAGVPTFKDTAMAPASELTYEVIGDGKTLWKSNPTNKLDDFQTCEVIVEKVKVLTLKVHCPKSGSWARSCWLAPTLAE